MSRAGEASLQGFLMRIGGKIIIVGVIVFLLGAIAVPAAIIISFFFHDAGEIQFRIPASITYQIQEPGRYYLWNDYQTVFEGVSYNRSKNIPDGISIVIRDRRTGAPYKLTACTSISSKTGGGTKNSIGYIDAENTGAITIDVSGGTEERIFSFSRFTLGEIFGRIFGGLGLAFLVCITGGGLVAWGVVKASREKKTEKISQA